MMKYIYLHYIRLKSLHRGTIMKKHLLVLMSLLVGMMFVLSCASEVPKTGNAAVDMMNQTLAKYPIEGFPSGKEASKDEWNKMITRAVPVVKETLPKIPVGFHLQTTGHTDISGGAKSDVNMKLSAARAKSVYDELRKRGIRDPKLSYKGVGGTMISKKCKAGDNCQRRVTFIIVK